MIHAEVHAILQVEDASKLKGATVFILECADAKGHPTFETAHPCPNCNNVLTRCGVRQAIFTREEGGLGAWAFNNNPDLEAPTLDTARDADTWSRNEKRLELCKLVKE